MYCPTCRQERLGTFAACIACGASLHQRAREEIVQELAHVRFVARDLERWDRHEVNDRALRYARGRYEQMERVLDAVLNPAPIVEPTPEPEVVVEAAAPVDEPVVEPPAPAPPPLPIAALEVPLQPSVPDEIVAAASNWSEVWKPFLYERIGWFLGAFLILAGSFYFVAVSWSSMSQLVQTVVVFGLTAAYSAAFSLGGAFLRRKASFGGAGSLLMLIGSAIAPLAPLALNVAEYGLLSLPLLLCWSFAAAGLFGVLARALDEPSHRAQRLLMFVTTLLLGAAPLLASSGPGLVWLDAVPLLLVHWALRAEGTHRSVEAKWFVALAPLFLLAEFALRVHLQLHALPLGTYAPFVAWLLFHALKLSRREEGVAANPLSIAVVGAQVACVVASAWGDAPAFFITSAVVAWTCFKLAEGQARRARWLYGAYAAAMLAYQTCGQLVPGVVKDLADRLKAGLGYPPAAPFPFNFDSVYALPFVIAVALFAARLLRRREDDERSRSVAEVLLRCTAGASLLFSAVAFAGSDLRAALYGLPAFAVLCLALGAWLRRDYLSFVGASLLLPMPLVVHAIFGGQAAAIAAGGAAVLLTAHALYFQSKRPVAVAGPAVILSVAAVALGWVEGLVPGVAAVLLGGASMAVLGARVLRRRELVTLATAALMSAAPLFVIGLHPQAAPLALAFAVLVAAFAPRLGEDFGPVEPAVVLGAFVAPLWCLAIGTQTPSLLGACLLLGGAALLELSFKFNAYRPFGAVLAAMSLFANVPELFVPWDFMTPLASACLLSFGALGASIITARSGKRSATTLALAATSCVGLLLAALSTPTPLSGAVSLIAAVGALLATRALHPRASIPLSALLAIAPFVGKDQTLALLCVAVFFAALALLAEWPRAHELLTGAAPIATVSSLASAVALLASTGNALHAGLGPALLAPTVGLSLIWLRATKRPFFAAIAAPLLAITLVFDRPVFESSFVWALPIAYALLSRLIPLVHSGDEKWSERMQRAAFIGFALAALGLSPWLDGTHPQLAVALTVGFLAGAGGPLWLRLGFAASVAAFVPELRSFSAPLLLAVAFLAHHRKQLTHRVLGAPVNDFTAPMLGILAAASTLVPWIAGWPSPMQVATSALVLAVCSLLLRSRWVLAAAVVLAALTHGLHPFTLAVVAGVAAMSSALLADSSRADAISGISRKVGPGFDQTLHVPMWASSAAILLLAIGSSLADGVASSPLLVVPALLLCVTTLPLAGAAAIVLCASVVATQVPFAWAPAAVSLIGLVAAFAGARFESDFKVGRAVHHAGWGVALAALALCHDLRHVATPLAFGFTTLSLWVAARRRPAAEPPAWVATLVGAHVAAFHAGLVFSTGKPDVYIFPYVSALSALLASAALQFASPSSRRRIGYPFAAVALFEGVLGVALLPLASGSIALPETVVSLAGAAVLAFALFHFALKERATSAGYLAVAATVVGYLCVRAFGIAPHRLMSGDVVASLLAGVIFSGLHAWAGRQDPAHVLRRPLWVAAVALPLLGLIALPLGDELISAALLAGYAAHFAIAAGLTRHRRLASVLSAAAFNGALFFAWLGTHSGPTQYFLVPAALSVLVLTRVFKRDLTEPKAARVRAIAVTVVYLAASWPILFSESWQMLLCATICVAGVGVGIALRVRSWVYLGTGFLVTSILANLAQFGVRDPRLGAVFLSLLGLLIVGFMVFVTARRADVLLRYHRVRQMLAEWEG